MQLSDLILLEKGSVFYAFFASALFASKPMFGTIFVPFGPHLDPSEDHLGAPLDALDPSWDRLEAL